MKLSYHGATYTYTPRHIETIETSIDCCFLGKTSKLRVAKPIPTEQARYSLTYRGVGYQPSTALYAKTNS